MQDAILKTIGAESHRRKGRKLPRRRWVIKKGRCSSFTKNTQPNTKASLKSTTLDNGRRRQRKGKRATCRVK